MSNRAGTISPDLTVQASKHLTFIQALNRRSRPNEQERQDIAKHAKLLKEAVDRILEEAKNAG